MKNGIKGYVNGVERIFTHRNPQTGEFYCEETDKWYNSKTITWEKPEKKRRKA